MKPSAKKPPPSSSSKTTAAHGGAAYFSSSYDDIYAGASKHAAAVNSTLAPRAEDYSEIFSGFRTSSSSRASSSIPVLDLPAVNAAEFDGCLDYDVVFGGLRGGVDFAVPFDELFRSSDGFDASDDDDAWTPIGTESLSDDSDPFAFSEKNQCFLNGISNQPLESNQYNISYQKVNPETSTYFSDTIDVAQLNDVPGYTCVVKEATSSGKVDERFCSQAVDDIVLNMEPPPIITQKHVKKTVSNISSLEDAGFKSFDIDPRSGRTRSVSSSHVNSLSPSDIDLPTKSSDFTPPSRSPAEKNRCVNGLSPSPKASENYSFETTSDDSLPPFFDMEIDASSSAAVSAAAMKDVMDKAQAKLKAAREFRGKKDTSQNGGEVGSETDIHGGDAELAHSESVSVEKRSHATTDREAKKNKGLSKEKHSRNVSQILPNNLADEQPGMVNGQPTRSERDVPKHTAVSDAGGEWKEASQYFEFVSNDSSRSSANQAPSNGGQKNGTFKQQYNHDSDSDSAGESLVMQNNRRRLKATKSVSRQGYYEKMVKVAQEVHNTVTSSHVDTKEGLQDAFHDDHKDQKSKLVETEKDEDRVLDTHRAEAKSAEVIIKAEAEITSKNGLENETVGIRKIDSNHIDLDGSIIDPPVNVSKESVKGAFEREESGRGVNGSTVELITDVLKKRKTKKSREVKETIPNVDFRDVLGGERPLTTLESKDNGRTEDMHKMRTEYRRQTEASEDGAAKERLGKTCIGQENLKTTQVPHVFGHDEHLGNDTNGRESEMILDHNVELEKCWEYLETLEQEKSRLNLDKVHTPVEENNLAERREIDGEENVVEAAEKGNVQCKLKQASELEECVNICEDTDFKDDLSDEFKSHMETEGKDEVEVPDSSSDTEPSIKGNHQKLSDEFNLNDEDAEFDAMHCASKSSHIEANGSLEASSGEENGEADAALLRGTKLKAFETSDVQSNEEEVRCTTPLVCPNDKKLERSADPVSLKPSQMKSDDTVKVSAGKENGDVNIVMSEETRSKAAETTDVVNENQTVLGAAQKGPGNDVYERNTPQLNEKETKFCDSSSHNHIPTNNNIKVAHSGDEPKFVKAPSVEREEMTKNLRTDQAVPDEEKNVRPAQQERMNGWNAHPSKRVGRHPVVLDRKHTFPRTSQASSLGQNSERNGLWPKNRNGSLDEKHDDIKTDLEKEHLRKLEEEREREREREKDKMAVEVAIREARERAYADARDRAERAALERATEELRQKAMAEARERLEKACAEARERSFTDKTSEDRLRAERSAVERATAEARQRAIEKSIADRAMFESRERVQRTMSEKYLSERDVIMRQTSFPSTSERSETGNGEPAQRCKARLERHRRTVERVAKALEEKNMRDLQSQREQAERNRFAETLDADIKRWSSGKAGNLRALLSTLQYILGPDSGWQPIPLTEVVTAAAVKKAYRKATLCVHPDKLQQRGASIQQKYVSEKVFDLLKEAWNGFNSEEK